MNRVFLPDIDLDHRLNPVQTFAEALSEKDLLLMVVPSHVYRSVLSQLTPFLRPGMAIISATKGIENDTLKTKTFQSFTPNSLSK